MDVNRTSEPKNELLRHALELADALRDHARATRAVMEFLGDGHYLTSMLVAAVENDSWEWMWKLHRISRPRLLVEELVALATRFTPGTKRRAVRHRQWRPGEDRILMSSQQRSREPGSSRFAPRFLKRLVDRANLATIPVIGLFFLLRPLGLIAPIPYWEISALILSADLVNTLVVASLPETDTGGWLGVRVAIEMGVIAGVVYGIGWGPILAVGFVFCAADAMRSSSSMVAKPAIFWMFVFIALGQLAIFLGIAPTLISQPLVHGLAVLGAMGAALTIKLLQWFAVSRESSEARFKVLVQHASDIVAVVDSNRCFRYMSPSFTRTLGWSTNDFEASPAAQILHPDDLHRLFAQKNSEFTGAPDGALRNEIRLLHSDGTWRWFKATVTDHLDDPNVRGIVANLHDITEQKTLEDELRHQAFHDSLTGLANRALFADRVDHALSRQRRTGEPCAVLLVDLDDFKAINDSLGHGMGDHLLVEAARRLHNVVRSSDTVARLGGDEFAILLEDVQEDGPDQVAERVIIALRDPIVLHDRAFVISASVGAALSTQVTSSADELIRNADVAMYSAKERGKGLWAPFEPGMHVAVEKRLDLKLSLLEAASSGDQMELYYQPVVDLKTRQTVGVEALLRWNHPRHGVVPPLEFLPLAEESGLIVALGRWVLREAVTQLMSWQRDYPALATLTMSVNVSARELEDPHFVGYVHEVLEESGIDPSALVLEVTESILMKDTDNKVTTLSQLKALSVSLALDDFGTGYSSLGYLQRFPFDVLKVDRSFIAALRGHTRQGALAEAIMKVGETLDLKTIAEGVELEEEALQLHVLGCEYAQGYLFAKPVPALTYEALFAQPLSCDADPRPL